MNSTESATLIDDDKAPISALGLMRTYQNDNDFALSLANEEDTDSDEPDEPQPQAAAPAEHGEPPTAPQPTGHIDPDTVVAALAHETGDAGSSASHSIAPDPSATQAAASPEPPSEPPAPPSSAVALGTTSAYEPAADDPGAGGSDAQFGTEEPLASGAPATASCPACSGKHRPHTCERRRCPQQEATAAMPAASASATARAAPQQKRPRRHKDTGSSSSEDVQALMQPVLARVQTLEDENVALRAEVTRLQAQFTTVAASVSLPPNIPSPYMPPVPPSMPPPPGVPWSSAPAPTFRQGPVFAMPLPSPMPNSGRVLQ